MGVALIIIGAILFMAQTNDKLGALGAQVKNDFFGANGSYGFLVWAAAILAIGAILRIADLPEAGKMLIVLVILAYLLGNANIPSQLASAVKSAGSGH
jgi:hypothetical protein